MALPIRVDADLPGFRKEDVNLSMENGTLTITAERREESEPQPQQGQKGKQEAQSGQSTSQPADYLLRERRTQRSMRSFTLPPNIDEQNVQAKLDDGVLKITLNQREESKPKRIQLQ